MILNLGLFVCQGSRTSRVKGSQTHIDDFTLGPLRSPPFLLTFSSMPTTIDVGAILRYGSLFCGLFIAIAGLLATLNVFQVFNLSYMIFSLSQILFGVLIAQTFHPIQGLCKWFPFVMPFVGRGCFMVYVGLGLFYGDFGFTEIVGLFTVLFGFTFIFLSCTGKVSEPESNAQQTKTPSSGAQNNANRV